MRFYFILEHVGGRGGVETVVTKVTQSLSTEGHDVHVFLPSPSTDTSWEKLLPNVHYYQNEKLNIDSRIQLISERAIGLGKSLSQLPSPDVLIATHAPQTVLYSRIAIGTSCNSLIVSWLHNPPEYFREPHLINYADIHWTISKGIKQKVEGILSNTAPVTYIGNPFELNVTKINPTIGQHFVFIGRLENQQKRLDLLFQALSQFPISWTLDIFGTGPDEENIKELAVEFNLLDKIKFHGWVENPWDKIQVVTALVLTSDFEGMPMVIGEAMTRGVPVISTDCETGPSDLIINGQNGWLTPTGNVQNLIRTFHKVSLLSQDELNLISSTAKKSIDCYSLEKVLLRMKKSLNELKEKKSGEYL